MCSTQTAFLTIYAENHLCYHSCRHFKETITRTKIDWKWAHTLSIFTHIYTHRSFKICQIDSTNVDPIVLPLIQHHHHHHTPMFGSTLHDTNMSRCCSCGHVDYRFRAIYLNMTVNPAMSTCHTCVGGDLTGHRLRNLCLRYSLSPRWPK